MANHSVIALPAAITAYDLASHAQAIINYRFKGRLLLREADWPGGRAAWTIEAPGTAGKHVFPYDWEENLGFIFWLHSDGRSVEIRHVTANSWLRWVQNVFKHEMAAALEVAKFDGGDGEEETNPGQYKNSLYAFATRNLAEPLTDSQKEFVEQHFVKHIPPGW